jgi:hypothetical protein
MIPKMSAEAGGEIPFPEGCWIDVQFSVYDSVREGKEEEITSGQLYIASFFWAIQTVTTVGYGGLSGSLVSERVFCIIIMLIGVMAFTFANGTLASILSSYDEQNVSLNDQLAILNKIQKEFKIPYLLYTDCKKHLELDLKNEDE